MKKYLAVMTLCLAAIVLAGCPSQAVLAGLTSTLGNAAASIASLQGNTALAQQLQTDTAAATTAIQNWKSGTPSQNAVQALQVVVNDLNLVSQIPGADRYAPLIAIALSTAISIIEIINPGSVQTARAQVKVAGMGTAGAPKTSKEFKARWNAICASNAQLASAAIK